MFKLGKHIRNEYHIRLQAVYNRCSIKKKLEWYLTVGAGFSCCSQVAPTSYQEGTRPERDGRKACTCVREKIIQITFSMKNGLPVFNNIRADNSYFWCVLVPIERDLCDQGRRKSAVGPLLFPHTTRTFSDILHEQRLVSNSCTLWYSRRGRWNFFSASQEHAFENSGISPARCILL